VSRTDPVVKRCTPDGLSTPAKAQISRSGAGETKPLGGNLGSTDPRLCLMMDWTAWGRGTVGVRQCTRPRADFHRALSLVASLSQGVATLPERLSDGQSDRGGVQDAGGLELQEQPPVAGLGQRRLKRQDRSAVVPVGRAVWV